VISELPRAARVFCRLIPPLERDAIIGDLLEDAASRDLSGHQLSIWLSAQCAGVGVGVGADRLRAWCLPPVRETASAIALEGMRSFRGGAIDAIVSLLFIFAAAAALAVGVELLIATLLAASYR
jgi:hypothetical protein